MSASELPTPDQVIPIVTLTHLWKETLDYLASQAIEQNLPGSLDYDSKTDTLTYYIQPNSLDRELFDLIWGIDEVWIITRARSES